MKGLEMRLSTEEELRYAKEGLEQMQQPDAGYFQDINDKQPDEIVAFNRDFEGQTKAIERLERKLRTDG